MTKICVPVTGDDIRGALELAHKAIAGGAALVEIRADLIPGATPHSIRQLFGDLLDRAVITLRSIDEGGKSDLSADERISWFGEALELPAAFIDLELDLDSQIISRARGQGKRTIVSKHILGGWDRQTVSDYLSRCCDEGTIGKVAVMVENSVEAVDLLNILPKNSHENHALMAMGPGAEITRALAGNVGAQLVYCALSGDVKVAPGQLDLRSQRRVASKDGIIVGLIGHPLHHSLSPIMQNSAFDILKIPGIYLPFDIPKPGMVQPFLRSCANLNIRGFNVTIPYKEVAFKSVDEIDDDAQRAGAINTVVIDRDRTLRGYNTDIFGFSEALRIAGFDPSGRRVLITGAGGAARAAVIALSKAGARILIANRTPERATALIGDLKVKAEAIPLSELASSERFDLIVNATPVGMTGFSGSQILPDEIIARSEAVMDMIYNPLETGLIASARRNGKTAISGIDMLLFQGAKAFELWTGEKAPVEIMRKALREAILK